MSSTDYQIGWDTLSSGGSDVSNSTSYVVRDTIDGTAVGDSASTTYGLKAGYRQAFQEQTISFDIDTVPSNGESASPYTLDLGTITTSIVRTSGNGGSNRIFLDINSNATLGAVVSVQSANAALQSVSSPSDKITSSTATLTAGTAGYGLCVATLTENAGGPLVADAPFNGSCSSTQHSVGGLDGSLQAIIDSSGEPIAEGRAIVLVKAAVSSSTPSHNDYADTLTFIATAKF